MIRIFTAAVIIFFSASLTSAERKALTDDGKKVILYDNGTWKYSDTVQSRKPVQLNQNKYSRPLDSSANITGQKNRYRIWYNPKKWTLMTRNLSEISEYSLRHTDGDGYCMIIPERTSLDANALKEIVLENALKAAPNSRITSEELRTVNGTGILHVEIRGTIGGIRFVYYNYLYTGKEGSIQFITFTSENLFAEYKKDFEDILNGFEIIESHHETQEKQSGDMQQDK